MKTKKHRSRTVRVRIRGKWWRIQQQPSIIVNGAEVRGLCDKEERLITHDGGDDMAFTIIHEVLHACFWDIEEVAIEEAEEAIKTALTRLKLLVSSAT